MTADPHAMPPIADQAQTLITLGVHRLARLPATRLRDAAHALGTDGDGSAVLAVHPELVRPAALTPLLRRADKPGFVVTDMTDVDQFSAIASVTVPDGPLYLVRQPDRGDALADWTPDAALPAILQAGRSPLLLTEGIAWVLQRPEVLARGHCFMTIGSRLVRPDGTLDSRTPAIWISGGTGRDGAANRNAPKVGWCWAGNRHSWLGFASCSARTGRISAAR